MVEGNSLVHRAHHVAQKYSRTALPRQSDRETRSPASDSRVKAGAGSASRGTMWRFHSRSSKSSPKGGVAANKKPKSSAWSMATAVILPSLEIAYRPALV